MRKPVFSGITVMLLRSPDVAWGCLAIVTVRDGFKLEGLTDGESCTGLSLCTRHAAWALFYPPNKASALAHQHQDHSQISTCMISACSSTSMSGAGIVPSEHPRLIFWPTSSVSARGRRFPLALSSFWTLGPSACLFLPPSWLLTTTEMANDFAGGREDMVWPEV